MTLFGLVVSFFKNSSKKGLEFMCKTQAEIIGVQMVLKAKLNEITKLVSVNRLSSEPWGTVTFQYQ